MPVVMKRCILSLVLIIAMAGCRRAPGMPSSPAVEQITAPEIPGLLSAGTNPVTLVHFWATWCPPCVREFPDIVRLTKTFRRQGLRVILISADAEKDRDAVSAFLAAHDVDWPTFQADNVNEVFIQAISTNWSGALPASFFYGSDGKLAKEWEGAHPYAAHDETVRSLLINGQKGEREHED